MLTNQDYKLKITKDYTGITGQAYEITATLRTPRRKPTTILPEYNPLLWLGLGNYVPDDIMRTAC